jgi:hypothetical protein
MAPPCPTRPRSGAANRFSSECSTPQIFFYTHHSVLCRFLFVPHVLSCDAQPRHSLITVFFFSQRCHGVPPRTSVHHFAPSSFFTTVAIDTADSGNVGNGTSLAGTTGCCAVITRIFSHLLLRDGHASLARTCRRESVSGVRRACVFTIYSGTSCFGVSQIDSRRFFPQLDR